MLKKVVCPVCSRRLFDTDEAEQVNMRLTSQGAPKPGLFYVKCSKCASTWAAALSRNAKNSVPKQ